MMSIKLLETLIAGTPNRILFTGIGNVLRSDDGAGVYIVKNLIENKRFWKILAEVSLENYVSRINLMHPDVLVLVDCIDFGKKPGYIALIHPDDTFETTVNTHNLTLKRIAEFFTMPAFILGIQPSNLQIGEELSAPVKKSADELICALNQMMSNSSDPTNRHSPTVNEFTNTFAYDNR